MRTVIYIDGAVGVGKSTLIEFLEAGLKQSLGKIYEKKKSSYKFRVDVLPEPLHRDWTSEITEAIGYDHLLNFLLERKKAAIDDWNRKIAADGLQELEENFLIVERSFLGDLCVRPGHCNYCYSNLSVCPTKSFHILLCDIRENREEEERIARFYTDMECKEYEKGEKTTLRFTRPMDICDYLKITYEIIKKVTGHGKN